MSIRAAYNLLSRSVHGLRKGAIFSTTAFVVAHTYNKFRKTGRLPDSWPTYITPEWKFSAQLGAVGFVSNFLAYGVKGQLFWGFLGAAAISNNLLYMFKDLEEVNKGTEKQLTGHQRKEWMESGLMDGV